MRAFIQRSPNAFHITIISVSSFFGLATAPSLIPLTATLAMLLLYAPILFHRPHRVMYTALLWFSITLSTSFRRLAPTLNSLSTAGPSVAVLLAMTSLTSAFAIFAIFLDLRICTRVGTNQAVFFPAIWTTLWAASSRMPLGRLTSWSPVLGTQSYSWTAPWVGTTGIDWTVAAWAVVISQSIGIWYMGDSEDEVFTTRTSESVTRSHGTWILAGFLTALTIPSLIFSGTPLPVNPPETISPFTIGCVLPSASKYNYALTLDDYITESKSVHATLLLWPEGAVAFSSESERDAGFKHIQQAINNQATYWAVSFEDVVPDPSDDTGRTSISRTGVAILSNSPDVHLEYYKRHLVPIAESFPLTPGSSPPMTYNLPLVAPRRVKRPQWGSPPNYTRPISLTASICLDFATPSPFQDLDSRPALILAPARTWDPAIGGRMWEEVKQRANEIGSMALWCDGGKGGVSGVAGGGYSEIFQVGEGSWVRTVGIQHPFDFTRTFYARFGDTPVFAASWFFVFASHGVWLVLPQLRKSARRLHVSGTRCIDWIAQKRGRPQPVPQANLIDY
ncbi:hypothetical protein C8R44DRAFT_634246 [Mycena epipterygia]|nr:hypothetical protein C8R44DRAFT_634246 [Mycena epipterygia]